MSPLEALEDHLATPQEAQLIRRLRSHVTCELATRRAQGRCHDCLFGDFALLRVLRGNDGNLVAAHAWLQRCIGKVDECNLDELVMAMAAELDDASSGMPSDSMLPYQGEVNRYMRALFTAPKQTPRGDVVNYFPLCRFDKRALLENLEWSHFVRYMQGATILRMVECDRLTRQQGRIVKVVTLVDMAECTLATLSCPRFDLAYARDVGHFQESVAAEVFGTIYVLNTPGFVIRLFGVFSSFLPERFRQKLHLIRGNGFEDDDFVQLVGGPEQLREMLALRSVFSNVNPQSEDGLTDLHLAQKQYVMSGREFTYSMAILPGQHVRWAFRLLAGSADRLLGESDIQFAATVFWTATEAAGPLQIHPYSHKMLLNRMLNRSQEALVKPEMVTVSQGEVKGELTACRPGVLFLRWSNRHSYLRGKLLRFQFEVVNSTEESIAAPVCSPSILIKAKNGVHGSRNTASAQTGLGIANVACCCAAPRDR